MLFSDIVQKFRHLGAFSIDFNFQLVFTAGQLTAPLLEFLNFLITKELDCPVLPWKCGSPKAELRSPWDVPFPLGISATQNKIQPWSNILDLGLLFWDGVFGGFGFGLGFFVRLFYVFYLVCCCFGFFFCYFVLGWGVFYSIFCLFGGCCCGRFWSWHHSKLLLLKSAPDLVYSVFPYLFFGVFFGFLSIWQLQHWRCFLHLSFFAKVSPNFQFLLFVFDAFGNEPNSQKSHPNLGPAPPELDLGLRACPGFILNQNCLRQAWKIPKSHGGLVSKPCRNNCSSLKTLKHGWRWDTL